MEGPFFIVTPAFWIGLSKSYTRHSDGEHFYKMRYIRGGNWAVGAGTDLCSITLRWVTHLKSVLIVDDSRFARLTLRRIVEVNFPDWFIAEAADGAEALSVLGDVAAEFILLDYNMPGDDGIVVAEKIRLTRPDARIAILTANVQNALSERAQQQGLGFMKKPAKEGEVVAFLRGL